MPKTEQDVGEARVASILVDPLDRLGLARPKGTKAADFDGMKRELCVRLWRMDAGGLQDLCDWVLNHIEARENNRWPPAAAVLLAARPFLPPPWPPSDRMVAIFNCAIGRAAIAGGWSPELFHRFVGVTSFPDDHAANAAFRSAAAPLARLAALNAKIAAGDDISDVDRRWRDRRMEIAAYCERIRDYKPAAAVAGAGAGGDAAAAVGAAADV